jgi:hypothetical protein
MARASIVPVLDVIHRRPLIDGMSSEGIIPTQRIEGRVELKSVVFAYPSRPEVNKREAFVLLSRA